MYASTAYLASRYARPGTRAARPVQVTIARLKVITTQHAINMDIKTLMCDIAMTLDVN